MCYSVNDLTREGLTKVTVKSVMTSHLDLFELPVGLTKVGKQLQLAWGECSITEAIHSSFVYQ